jgi:hypothetical protein
MKPISGIVFAACVFAILAAPSPSYGAAPAAAAKDSLPAPTERRVVERGGNHRVWQWETYEKSPAGQIVARPHQITELAAGLHYQDASGQWVEAQEMIEPFSGGAIAQQGQHQVIFANNLNSHGAIDMQTPDKKRLRSNILGLMYVDTATGDAAFIARIQDSTGVRASLNQVLYANAFEGVLADVRYTYKRGSFEQDVILREQPPAPEAYGLNPETTVLEVVTEFLNPPPATITGETDAADDQRDETIVWGSTTIGRGKAFDLSDAKAVHGRMPVNKRYLNIDGRHYLIEQVQMKKIRGQLNNLPLQAASKSKPSVMASKHPQFPNTPLARVDEKSKMKLASMAPSDQGYVLDYVTVSAAQTNFTFQGT